jgi:hypothetical protein
MIFIILFFSIYWISLPIAGNSLFLIAGLLVVSNLKFYANFICHLLLFRVNFIFLMSALMLIALSVFVGYWSYSYDFSYALLISKQIPYFFSAGIVGIYLGSRQYANFRIESKLLDIGVVQGLIVLTALFSSDFRLMLLPFQGSEDVEFLANENNMGIRGFALSSQQFFGLSAMLCIKTALIIRPFFINNNLLDLKFLIKFFVFGIACVFVGRTSGIFFSLCLLYVVLTSKSFSFILTIALASIFSFYLIDYEFFESPSFLWAFEPLVNFLEHGSFESSSFTELKEEMLWWPTLQQMLFGDGIYTSIYGGYYLGTDSGFMRPILFSGILVFVVLLIPYLEMMRFDFFYGQKKYRLLYSSFPLILAVVLQVKGEVFITGTMVNVLLIMYYSFLAGLKIVKKNNVSSDSPCRISTA